MGSSYLPRPATINGLTSGARQPGHKDPFVQLPHTPAPRLPTLGESAAQDAKTFRGAKPARRCKDGEPGPG